MQRGDFITAQMVVASMERLALDSWGEDSWQRGLSLVPVARFYEATNPEHYIPTLEEYIFLFSSFLCSCTCVLN